MKIALVAITRGGAQHARRLAAAWKEADFFLSEKYKDAAPEATPFGKPIQEWTAENFGRYDGIVYFISLGAVVRTIAPFLKDKHTDPAVVVVDDRAKFAISVLSGHVGGANELAQRVAEQLGAQPVITTASDVGRTIPVDILGREFGWIVEKDDFVTPASAAVVNEEPVCVYQEAGERNWWKRDSPLPKNIFVTNDPRNLISREFKAYLIITDRILPPKDPSPLTAEQWQAILKRAVVYRPRTLVVGLGCDRGVAKSELLELIYAACEEAGVSPKSIGKIATHDGRAEEPAFLSLQKCLAVPIVSYTKEELNSVAEKVKTPSEASQRYLGLVGVAEPAAILASGAPELLLSKRKSAHATCALARLSANQAGTVERVAAR